MSTLANAINFSGARSVEGTQVLGGKRFDWAVTLLSALFMIGMYFDTWAHNNIVDELEDFFTPWHAMVALGSFLVLAFLGLAFIRNVIRGYSLRTALPAGYGLSLVGALLFQGSFVGDMVWHGLFGIEANVEALLSPTHLLLATGMVLIFSGPYRAAWQRPGREMSGQTVLPMLISMTLILAPLTNMTQIFHPILWPWEAVGFGGGSDDLFVNEILLPALGVTQTLLQTGILFGVVLFTVRRWKLPLGSLTLVFALNAVALTAMRNFESPRHALLIGQVIAGIIADGLIYVLKPSAERPASFRIFAASMPVILYALHYAGLLLTVGVWWSVSLWTGAIAVAGIAGLLLSYLVVPPAVPVEQRPELADRQSDRQSSQRNLGDNLSTAIRMDRESASR